MSSPSPCLSFFPASFLSFVFLSTSLLLNPSSLFESSLRLGCSGGEKNLAMGVVWTIVGGRSEALPR